MSTNNVKLIDENNNEIVGVELSDGAIGKINFTHHTAHQIFDCKLPSGVKENSDGTNTFHLSNGKAINRELKSILDLSEHSHLFPKHLFP